MNVPLNDLHAQYISIKDEIDSAIANVISKSSFIRGEDVESFEEQFASLVNANACVSCGNGTDALYIAMKALGTGPGDEVIVPAQSWISTSETVSQTGAKPVFCDIEAAGHTMDATELEHLITPNTVGIIPVHLYGRPADMNNIVQIAKKHCLWIVEDCAQAHLATYEEKQVGSFGIAATYSFYPGKNLGAMGDAGAITTSSIDLANKMAMFARHGGVTKGEHLIEGMNSRMDGIQAAVLNVKLQHLENWTARRREIAATYEQALHEMKMPIETPLIENNRECSWHLFVIQHAKRDKLKKFLASKGIASAVNYPTALPFLPAYNRFKHKATDFPNAFRTQSRILSLPIYPELSEESISLVLEGISEFHRAN